MERKAGGGLDQGRYGGQNARKMVVRVWILRQHEDFLIL